MGRILATEISADGLKSDAVRRDGPPLVKLCGLAICVHLVELRLQASGGFDFSAHVLVIGLSFFQFFVERQDNAGRVTI